MSRTAVVTTCAIVLGVAAPAVANHSWSNYHWARNSSSFTLKVVDSVTPRWQYAFDQSLVEWAKSNKLDLQVVAADDSSRTRKRCQMVSGRMRVCNASYGKNGWLGLASINIDSSGHITQGTAKMNDSYAYYFDGTPGEDNHVMCQEIGHVFGLGHTSEDGSSQNTCMDYSTSLNSQWPNQHDYDQLSTIYNHIDSYNTWKRLPPVNDCPGCALSGIPNDAVLVNHHPSHGDQLGHADFVRADGNGGFWLYHATLAPERDHDHED